MNVMIMRYSILLIALLFCSVSYAASVDQKVLSELQDSNDVAVIVVLGENTNPADAELSSSGFNKESELGLINGVSGTIGRSEIGSLLSNPLVESVHLNKPIYATLAESAPLVNATSVWQLKMNGVNITGAGETVCVVDTGINYTHPAIAGRFLGGYDFVNNDNDSMDDNGHGTHVAGIVASNNLTYRGIAPEASLVGIKVLNSVGSGSEGDVISGISWCVSNSTAYNISVISMSLAGGNYSAYCDDFEIPFRDAINAAVAKNISVIVASGNDGFTTNISVPACIQNATSVGSSTKADAISSFTNRNALLDLLAPGSSITSSVPTGGCANCNPSGFATFSGTSMATPHVAAAFALVRQFKRLENGTILNPAQIENILKSRGTNISDSGTGLVFQRISLLAAIRSIDTLSPLLSVDSPQNATYNTTNITLSYSASDLFLDTCVFTNTTGANTTLAGCSNTTFTAAGQQNNITIIVNDSTGHVNSSHVFFTIDTVVPLLSVIFPENTSYDATNISVNYSAADTGIDRCWFTNTSGAAVFLNSPRGACSNSSIAAETSHYNITIYVNDTGGNVNYTQIFFTANPMPLISFVPPTPANQTLDSTNDITINLTSNKALSSAILEWNGTNSLGVFVQRPDGRELHLQGSCQRLCRQHQFKRYALGFCKYYSECDVLHRLAECELPRRASQRHGCCHGHGVQRRKLHAALQRHRHRC